MEKPTLLGFIFLSTIIAFFIFGLVVHLREERTSGQVTANRLDSYSSEVAKDLQFFREPKTQLCFGISWGHIRDGGPALVGVRCRKILPEHLREIQ